MSLDSWTCWRPFPCYVHNWRQVSLWNKVRGQLFKSAVEKSYCRVVFVMYTGPEKRIFLSFFKWQPIVKHRDLKEDDTTRWNWFATEYFASKTKVKLFIFYFWRLGVGSDFAPKKKLKNVLYEKQSTRWLLKRIPSQSLAKFWKISLSSMWLYAFSNDV